MKVMFYTRSGKSQPVYDFIATLPVKERAKILACLKSVEELGFDCPRVYFRQIKGALWEIKIRTQSSGFRIFYVTIQSDTIVLLHVYRKQSQKTPKKEIEIAGRRMMEVMSDESYYIK